MVSDHASPLARLGGVDAGGQNVHVDALSRALAAKGVHVDVYTRRDDVDQPEDVEVAARYRVVHVDAGPPRPVPKDELLPHMGAFTEQLHARLAREGPSLIHAHFWMSGLAALECGRRLGTPVLQTFHALGVVKRREQGAADTSPSARGGIERRLVRSVDRVIATCCDEAFELIRLGLEPRRATVIPCGVDLDRFGPSGPVERRSERLRHRLVVVSRLVERKGIGNIIEALASVPDTELVIAGGPPVQELWADGEARRLRQLARRHAVDDRVDFRGGVSRSEVSALMRSADLVVSVPWYEPFGIVPVEAMACGVPVVATSVGGLLDTVVDGSTGCHVPPRTPARLAEALRDLLADEAGRARMGRAAAERAQRYGWERIASQTHAAYLDVLDGVPAPIAFPGRLYEESVR